MDHYAFYLVDEAELPKPKKSEPLMNTRRKGKALDSRGHDMLVKHRCPAALLKEMHQRRLVGSQVAIAPQDEPSGLGVDLEWMTPAQMVSEATEASPGKEAVGVGLYPIGICLAGTGDYYYYREHDGAVVRVPHDAVVRTKLDLKQVELIADSVAELIQLGLQGNTAVEGYPTARCASRPGRRRT
jgi:hypothetical protein